MTKSGTQCEGNENRKSQKPFIFANWTILSIFEKKFFWIIQKFQKPNLASKNIFLGSRFFPDLKFSPVVANLPNYQKKIVWTKSIDKKFTKKLTEWSKKHIFVIIEWTRFFIKNLARQRVLEFCPLTSDQKLEKSMARLLRSRGYTDGHSQLWAHRWWE